MAKDNFVWMRGIVETDPLITTLSNNKKLATFKISVMRPNREFGLGPLAAMDEVIDYPTIVTQDETMIEKVIRNGVQKNQIVEIKGVVITKKVLKTTYCEFCNQKNQSLGSSVQIYPIYLEAFPTIIEEPKDKQKYLMAHREISNNVRMFGTLTKKPKYIVTRDGKHVTQYQIRVGRKIKDRHDDPSIKADYPWVKVYGEKMAQSQAEQLDVGSEIYIDGFLQTRTIVRRVYCGSEKGSGPVNGKALVPLKEDGTPAGCGEMYYAHERTFEIVPYSTEFIGDYKSKSLAIAEQKAKLGIVDNNYEEDEDDGAYAGYDRNVHENLADFY